MSRLRSAWMGVPALLTLLATTGSVRAMPGFFVGKTAQPRVFHESHVVILRRGDTSVVTSMTDYEGPLEPFAIVLAVPADVKLDHVRTLKREFVDRVDQISAPRFHEWWEEDPCEASAPEQEWDHGSKGESAKGGFLGGGSTAAADHPPRELFVNVKPDYKQGEYTFSLVTPDKPLGAALRSKGYELPADSERAVEPYVKAGMNFLIAEVDPKRVELVGSDRAQLSPIRYESEQAMDKLPVRLGLLSSPGVQELFVYVLDPERRFEAKNYPNAFPPTNVEVDFAIKERISEFYAAVHDLWLRKNPEAILNEYAWHSSGCGEPCPNAPLLPAELLSLGGDVFEARLSPDERNPRPAPLDEAAMTAEQEELALLPAAEQQKRMQQLEQERRIVARNKAILERQKYVISRLHHRYGPATLPNDLEIAPASPVRGGIGVPEGENDDLSSEVTAASENRLQTRYYGLHHWQGPQNCAAPKRSRWGKPPRSYRGLRKVWIADDLARRNRTQIKPAQVIKTAIPALGISPVRDAPPAVSSPAPAASTAAAPAKTGACRCTVSGARGLSGFGWLAALLAGVLLRRRRGT